MLGVSSSVELRLSSVGRSHPTPSAAEARRVSAGVAGVAAPVAWRARATRRAPVARRRDPYGLRRGAAEMAQPLIRQSCDRDHNSRKESADAEEHQNIVGFAHGVPPV